jgi:amidase
MMRNFGLALVMLASPTLAQTTPPPLNAIIATNPDAAKIRKALDAERAAGKVRSPIHGNDVLIKDNIETADRMATTAGSLALKDNITGRDAPLVARLRKAGAVIAGKTNMSEWANIRSNRSMSGWSAIGGIVRNPYALDRTACGSSSGSGAAIAAGLAWAAIGTETDGSIVCPASINGIVGLKPTVGLVSRTHVIPISHSQDTPGPMTRTVRDAAMLLTVIAGSDRADEATNLADSHTRDYAAALSGSIKGVRIGVLRDQIGRQPGTREAFEKALITLKNAGAVLVDIEKTGEPEGLGKAEGVVLYTELKVDLNAYLATTPPTVKTRTLADLIAFNTANADREMPYFGQETFIKAEATKGLSDPAYLKALKESGDGARATLTHLLTDNNVDMLVAPTMGPAWITDPVNGDQYDGPSASTLPAVSGFPHLTVPMGLVGGLPVGLSFIGPAWSEARLLNAGDAFEKARGPFPAPTYQASIPIR